MTMIYCVSDIHGEIDKWHKMLELIEFSHDDTLYILGDVIDRKPGGVEILREIMRNQNMIMLLGNHEDMCLKTLGPHSEYGARTLWKSNGGNCTYRELLYHLADVERWNVIDYLCELPTMIDIEVANQKYRLVHAWPAYLEEDRLWARPRDNVQIELPEDTVAIIGHTPTPFLDWVDDETPFKIVDMRNWRNPKPIIAIDCGCGNQTELRRLACLRLDDMEVYYV